MSYLINGNPYDGKRVFILKWDLEIYQVSWIITDKQCHFLKLVNESVNSLAPVSNDLKQVIAVTQHEKRKSNNTLPR